MTEGKYNCPACRDRGYIIKAGDDGYEYAAPCKCKEIKAAKERLRQSGLARVFTEKSFDN